MGVDERKWREAEEFWKRLPEDYTVFHLGGEYSREEIVEMIRRRDPRARKFVEMYEELEKLLKRRGRR